MEREESQKGLLSSQKKLISSENIEKHASLDKIQNIDWENAVDFLKLQKENARKIEQNWSSEKRLLEVRTTPNSFKMALQGLQILILLESSSENKNHDVKVQKRKRNFDKKTEKYQIEK